jgi:hypothetical protein
MKMPLSKRKTKVAPADVLDRAADLLEERGWTRRILEDDNGCLSALGAINMAWYGSPGGRFAASGGLERNPVRESAIMALQTEINPYGGDPEYVIVNWNDSFAKNKRDVVATMRRAVKRMRAAA